MVLPWYSHKTSMEMLLWGLWKRQVKCFRAWPVPEHSCKSMLNCRKHDQASSTNMSRDIASKAAISLLHPPKNLDRLFVGVVAVAFDPKLITIAAYFPLSWSFPLSFSSSWRPKGTRRCLNKEDMKMNNQKPMQSIRQHHAQIYRVDTK